jgi:DNA invertase Pin-like site-specific DNA recombinase
MSANHSTAARAVAYYRMSTDRQEDSIDRQRSQVEPHAARHGYGLVRDYTDRGISGGEITRRKEFQQMLRDAQAGRFEVILCDDKDRFGRFDSIDLGEIVARLRRKGVRLETVAQGRIDWESFSGRITDAVLQEAKHEERRAISRRVLSNQLLKAGRGQDTGGRPLYGYRREADPERGSRLIPDGRKAEVVRLVFSMYDEGNTLFAVAEELYRRAVPSPRGGARWTRSVVQRLLLNRRYVGDWTWGVHASGKCHRYGSGGVRAKGRGDKAATVNAAEAWVVRPDVHEPLVSREVFERVQARLKGNRRMTTPHPNGGDFALSRLLVCGHCGGSLVGITDHGKRNYVCGGYLAHGKGHCKRNTAPERLILDVLLRELQKAFLHPDNLQRLRQEVREMEAAERGDENLQRLRARARELGGMIGRGNENLAILPADRIPGVVAKVREWEAEEAAVKAELRRLESSSRADDLEQRIEAAERCIWNLREAAQGDDLPLLRDAVREMVKKVVLFWEHRQAGKVTRCRLVGGEIHPRTTEEPSELSPSAARSHC